MAIGYSIGAEHGAGVCKFVRDEYRGIIDDEQLKYDAEEICTVLKQKYPSTDISFLIKEAL